MWPLKRLATLLAFGFLIGAGCDRDGHDCNMSVLECYGQKNQLTAPGTPEVVRPDDTPPAVPEPAAVLAFGLGFAVVARHLSKRNA